MVLWVVIAAWAEPVVLPSGALEITFDTDTKALVADALAALARGAFEDAGRMLAALSDAGGGAEMHYLEAVAWYEAGQLQRASLAASDGLIRDPEHGPLASLQGLILADLGRGDEALVLLDAAIRRAGADRGLAARAEINRALVHLDRGEADLAGAALSAARSHATATSDADLLARIANSERQVASLRGLPGATDALGRVGELLARGDLAGARAVLAAAPTDRRSRVRAKIAQGAIDRAEGRFDAAQRALQEAVVLADEGGLLRESASAQAQLGVVFLASNRPELALTQLDVAIKRLSGTTLRVLTRSCRVEAARAALRSGRLKIARAHLDAARAIPGADPSASAAMAEVTGLLALEEGDLSRATTSLTEAARSYEALGAPMDAARAWTGLVSVHAGVDAAALSAARDAALAAFAKANDPMGPAHVGIAEGLGRAQRRDLEGAMTAFIAAAKAAQAVQGERGKSIARIAKENAAKTVAELAGSAVVLEQANRWGVEDLVARNTTYKRGRTAYDKALAEYQAGRYDAAIAGFDSAVRDLESIGETGYARVARRGRAWARFNAYTHADPVSGLPVWQDLIEEGSLLQDVELRIRSMAAAALAAAELGRPEAVRALAAAATEAESLGLRSLAGQCHASLADHLPTLDERVNAARKAYAMREGDEIGIHAIYSVAIAAYEQGAYDLAIELTTGILTISGELTPAVRQVLDASVAAKSGG